MSSAVEPDNLAQALDAAIRRFNGRSPVTEQVRYHFGRAEGRPLRMELVLAVAAAEGGTPEDALDAACAVEILHHYAQVHEAVAAGGSDGVPGRFGVPHGINAGDALCALAYLQLVAQPRRSPERTVAMTRALHEADYAMCAARADGADTTAVLLGAACELGALAAGGDPARAGAWGRLGRSYGARRDGLAPTAQVRTLLDLAR
jgi:geranylgeranyl diphosphate synthase type I